MNQVYETIQKHRSIRLFEDQKMPEADLKKILEVVEHSPTSINGQHCSIVVMEDVKKRQKLVELIGSQPWIAKCSAFLVFVADFARPAAALEKEGKEMADLDAVEASLVGTIDCGIAMGQMITLAESMGYGCVPIGAIRNVALELCDMLELPKKTYPILGMCLGIPAEDPKIKPKFSFDSLVHKETYKPITTEELERYDKASQAYMTEKTKGEDQRTWSQTMVAFYSDNYVRQNRKKMRAQGIEEKD